MSFQPQDTASTWGKLPPGSPPQPVFIPTLRPDQARLIPHMPWQPHTQITLQCTDAATISLLHLPPTPSTPPYPASHQPRPHNPPTHTTLPSGAIQATLYITHTLTRHVAVLADVHNPTTPARWIAKFYATHSEPAYRRRRELAAYTRLRPLQGAEVPHFYGEWHVQGMPRGACSALLLEMVDPGTTILSLREEAAAMPQGEERRRACMRLADLHSSGTRAVDRMQELEVAHGGLGGGSMVVAGVRRGGGRERVVLVGFAWAMVNGVDRGWKVWEHWGVFHAAFILEDVGNGGSWWY